MKVMIIRGSETKEKKVGPMKINEYKINSDFSAALIVIDGNHGRIKCIAEDRIYFIAEGGGDFVINDKTFHVSKDDMVFIHKNTPYNIIGSMKFLVISHPEFNPDHDIQLD